LPLSAEDIAFIDEDDDPSEYIRGDLAKATSKKMLKYQSYIDIYDHLIAEMARFRAAPSVLGMELTESKLAAIKAYIVSVIALFAGTIFGNYVQEYDALLD